jgi:SOS-response transcriptional repressor LexA
MHTDTVDAVYDFIRQFIDQKHYSPNYREIAIGCHIGRTSVSRYLDRLQIQGRIEYEPGKARSIRIVAVPLEDR